MVFVRFRIFIFHQKLIWNKPGKYISLEVKLVFGNCSITAKESMRICLFVCLFNYIFFFMFSDFHVHKVWSPEYVVRNRKSCFILFQARFWCGIRRSSTFFFFSKISHFSFSKFQHGQLNWRYIKTTPCSLVFLLLWLCFK